MNYKKIYYSIIENRQQNPPTSEYIEIHHIIPSSLGGTNDNENLVKLSAREHFICHYLLAKIYPKESFDWYKMNNAFLMMKCESYNQNRYFNSRLYEALKENFSTLMSFIQRGSGNSQYGTCWISFINPNLSKKIKLDKLPLYIEQGWIKGRNVFNKKPLVLKDKKNNIKKCSLIKIQKNESLQIKKDTNIKKTNVILDFIEYNKIESIAELHRMNIFKEYAYPQILINFLKRYNKERFQKLIKPGFSKKTTNRKSNKLFAPIGQLEESTALKAV